MSNIDSLNPRMTRLRAHRTRVQPARGDSGRGIITGGLIGILITLVGIFIGSKIGAIVRLIIRSISAYLLVSLFFNVVIFVYTFNWNISDEDLYRALKARRIAWYSQFGETLGVILGWTTCAVIPGAVVWGFNKGLAFYIWKEFGEEGLEEIVDSVYDLVAITARNELNKWAVLAFIWFRTLVRDAANDKFDRDPILTRFINAILRLFPRWKEALKKWGNGGSPWILAEKVEEAIEESNLSDEWKAFLEEFLESFGESCMEAGFVTARAIDQWFAEQSIEVQARETPETVVITPDRSVPNERVVLYGTPSTLVDSINSVMATHNFIEDRDIGRALNPDSAIQYVEQMVFPINVILYWRNKEKPPYGKRAMSALGKTLRTQQLTIPGFNRILLNNYSKIKRLMGFEGGDSTFYTGPYLVTASIPGFRPFQLYARNIEEGHIFLYNILEETIDPQIFNVTRDKVTMNVTYLVPSYSRDEIDALKRFPEKMYPYAMDVIVKAKLLHDADNANILAPNKKIKVTKQGVFLQLKTRLFLYFDDKPDEWDSIIAELTSFLNVTNNQTVTVP